MKKTTLFESTKNAVSESSQRFASIRCLLGSSGSRNAWPAIKQQRGAGSQVHNRKDSSRRCKIKLGPKIRNTAVLLLLLLSRGQLLHAQDFYQALYKEVESVSTPLNPSFKIAGLTLTSIDVLSPQKIDQSGFYGFGLIKLNPGPQKSFSALVRVYASKYSYKDYTDLTPISDLFSLNQAKYEYKLEFFPSGTVSYQFLINGKPFLNRPAVVAKAISYQKGYVQVDKLLMFIKVGSSLPTPPVKNIEIYCEPIISFSNLKRTPNAGNGTNLLAFGVNKVATVYRVQRIVNKGTKNFVVSYNKFRSVSNNAGDAYYGIGSSGTVISIVNSYHPNYFVNKSATITIPAGQTIELPGEMRIVVIYPTSTPTTPGNLFYDQQSVECKLIQNNYFDYVPVMDIERFTNFL